MMLNIVVLDYEQVSNLSLVSEAARTAMRTHLSNCRERLRQTSGALPVTNSR